MFAGLGLARVNAVEPAEPVANPALSDSEVLDELWGMWEGRRGEIVTADVQYRQFFQRPQDSTWSAAAVRQAVESLPAVPTLEVIATLAQRWAAPAVEKYPDGIPCRLQMLGDELRYESGAFISLRANALDLIYDGDNEQVGVYARGRSGRAFTTLTGLRRVPAPDVMPDQFRVTSHTPETVTLAAVAGDVRCTVDRATGLLTHLENVDPTSGALVSESWELDVVHFDDGIPFPSVRIDVEYAAGHLRQYTMRCLEHAVFNRDLSPASFQLACRQKTLVLDHRGSELFSYRLPTEVADVAASLHPVPRPSVAMTGKTPAAANGEWYRWLLAANGLLLIGGGVYLWRRARAASRATSP